MQALEPIRDVLAETLRDDLAVAVVVEAVHHAPVVPEELPQLADEHVGELVRAHS